MRLKNRETGEMSVRQAERILETFENGLRNGRQWAHDVVLQRGKANYQRNIDSLNEALRLKSIDAVVKPLAPKVEGNEEQANTFPKAPQSQRRRKQ